MGSSAKAYRDAGKAAGIARRYGNDSAVAVELSALKAMLAKAQDTTRISAGWRAFAQGYSEGLGGVQPSRQTDEERKCQMITNGLDPK